THRQLRLAYNRDLHVPKLRQFLVLVLGSPRYDVIVRSLVEHGRHPFVEEVHPAKRAAAGVARDRAECVLVSCELAGRRDIEPALYIHRTLVSGIEEIAVD